MLLCLCSITCKAQSMEDILLSMPREITPYLTTNQKKEMVECLHVGVSTSVQNQLHGTSTLDTLTNDFCQLNLSSSHNVQLIRLPHEDGDSIICLINTFRTPSLDSKISFYDLRWHKIDLPLMPELSPTELVLRPDTMSITEFDSLYSWIEPLLMEYSYSPDEQFLEASLSIPYTSVDEKTKLEAILCKRKLKWNSVSFEICY